MTQSQSLENEEGLSAALSAESVERDIVEHQLLQVFVEDLVLHEKLSPQEALKEAVRIMNDFEKKAASGA
jgi:transcription termination factor NusB